MAEQDRTKAEAAETAEVEHRVLKLLEVGTNGLLNDRVACCAVLFEMSNLLNTGLDKQTLAILVELIGEWCLLLFLLPSPKRFHKETCVPDSDMCCLRKRSQPRGARACSERVEERSCCSPTSPTVRAVPQQVCQCFLGVCTAAHARRQRIA
eukprot:3860111-Rhodomonas_salina.3